ncbi:hypothetical protein V8C86DRAFT_3106254 [Haematococcus lacustris]
MAASTRVAYPRGWPAVILVAWDRAIMHLEKAFGFVCAPHQWISRMDSTNKIIVCERGDLVTVCNQSG